MYEKIDKTIILCRPESSCNIGAVCRVMANTGISDLRIVGKKENYCEDEVLTLALKAENIWHNAKFFDDNIQGLKQAASDCSILVGTSRRLGHKRKDKIMSPEEFCADLNKFAKGKIGLLFGNERTGLTDEEISCCSFSINIPSDDNFGSYNLSHAVLILAYSIFISEKNITEKKEKDYCQNPFKQKADMGQIQTAAQTICCYLENIGMYKKNGKEANEQFFIELLSSAAASEFTVNHLTEIFKKICYINKK